MNIGIAIDPFTDKKGAKKPENVKPIQSEGDSSIAAIIEQFDHYLENLDMRDTYFDKFPLRALKPPHIYKVFSEIAFNTKPHDWAAGRYISELIQASYNEGNNDFVLNTQDFSASHLAYNLQGRAKRKLTIEIHGSVGHNFGMNSSNIGATIQGSALSHLGVLSEYSSFSAYGASRDPGFRMKKGEIHILGSIGNFTGVSAKESVFRIDGKVHAIYDSAHEKPSNCEFYLRDKGSHKLVKSFYDKGNKVVLVK